MLNYRTQKLFYIVLEDKIFILFTYLYTFQFLVQISAMEKLDSAIVILVLNMKETVITIMNVKKVLNVDFKAAQAHFTLTHLLIVV